MKRARIRMKPGVPPAKRESLKRRVLEAALVWWAVTVLNDNQDILYPHERYLGRAARALLKVTR